MLAPSAGMGETVEEEQALGWGYQELCFAHVFEMFIRHWSGDVGWPVKDNSLESRRGGRVRNKNVGIISM